ncbi:hypothetical protein HRI_003837300 [Hibiscus trionum]|uniref:Piwi domain-containing protein n=1 Tax=Hibiscus trionum TaxID=183268 RepID=A0A9W7IU75_HIBTR|nr:hypothetical protein HRI_003837300 [Hibiscus trionum]
MALCVNLLTLCCFWLLFSSSSQNCKTTADFQKGIVYGGMIRELLMTFRKSTNRILERIIFTNGVSEGQFSQVLLNEMDAIRKETSMPTHYHVLYDKNMFNADVLQMLTNSLCYIYARCTKSVSIG